VIPVVHSKLIPAMGLAGSLIGSAMVLFAQAVANPIADSAERIVGGSLLAVAAALIIRWTFRLVGEVRAIAAEQREAAEKRESQLLAQISEANRQLNAERQLRISLEQRGLEQRRKNGYEDVD